MCRCPSSTYESKDAIKTTRTNYALLHFLCTHGSQQFYIECLDMV